MSKRANTLKSAQNRNRTSPVTDLITHTETTLSTQLTSSNNESQKTIFTQSISSNLN